MQLENKGNIYNTDTTFCMVKVLVRCMLLSIHFHTTNNENNKTLILYAQLLYGTGAHGKKINTAVHNVS